MPVNAGSTAAKQLAGEVDDADAVLDDQTVNETAIAHVLFGGFVRVGHSALCRGEGAVDGLCPKRRNNCFAMNQKASTVRLSLMLWLHTT